MKLPGIFLGLLLVVCGRPLSAEIAPSFQLETSAWQATDIVVVAQQPAGLVIQEVWKGKLSPGETLPQADIPKAPIKVATWDPKATPRHVNGKRIVLFLRARPQDGNPGLPQGKFIGASQFGELPVSAAWIDDGETFAMQQALNPGPVEMWPLELGESKFKEQTLAIVAARQELTDVLALADFDQRLSRLTPMTESTYWHQRRESIAAMGECGPVAVPLLRRLMREYGVETPQLARALAEAAGDDAGLEMAAALAEEIDFWRELAPTLPVGWWNKMPEHHGRYTILIVALETIEAQRFVSAKQYVESLRDLWVSLPQLNDKSGINQVSAQCNQTLRALAKEPSP